MFQIDIGKIIQEKLGKKLPRFLVRLLEKLIHQDEMNEFLATDGRDKVGLEFVEASLKFLDVWVKIVGEENLKMDDKSKYCFVSNHPLGGIDGLILIDVIGNKCEGKVKVLLNSFLAALPGLEPFSVPVNVAGNTSKGILDSVNSVFASDDQILMFPAQLCSRKQHGVIKDLPWKKGFVQKSIEFDRTIIPIYFHGFNSKAFYNFAKFSNFLSKLFKAPGLTKLPMVFLPHEMIKNRGNEFTIVIGSPISSEKLKGLHDSKSYKEIAALIQNYAYSELKSRLSYRKSL
ncbi:glycerol acyltransferase [bacterium]|nr:glycerol acyltransferase [bacterium]